ncbi:MAG TPA: GntR family transcriptional regulator [Lachnospiraceae bacterium]|nr:GntR family transcriptional regulator [Lachnospiraceae bacterium]
MQITNKLAGETARDYAFRMLKENIISLELKPGSSISENELARELGISRTPVREAIIDLNKALIVEIYPQRGSYIALIDGDLVEESRFMRKVLDTAVIELACSMATKEDIALLEDNVKLQEYYLQNVAADKILELDNEFHKMIFSMTKKERIYAMKSTLMIHYDRVRTLSMVAVKDMKIVNDHRMMLEAIRHHDPVQASQLVEKHLNRYQIDEAEIRKKYPEYFKN